ncbi:MAG: hypothetical protein NZ482_10225, partial [Gloeomargarita sp. SKYG98]|nr:hypothetical protein [Gloeomargarita sp. SKYG98]
LFKSGTTYPNSVTLLLQANTDGQTQITLTVGELGGAGATEIDYDEMGRLCTRPATEQSGFRVLGAGSVQFPLEPPGKVGQDRLRATFAVNARRQLQVTVKDLRTGRTLLKDQVIARLG